MIIFSFRAFDVLGMGNEMKKREWLLRILLRLMLFGQGVVLEDDLGHQSLHFHVVHCSIVPDRVDVLRQVILRNRRSRHWSMMSVKEAMSQIV